MADSYEKLMYKEYQMPSRDHVAKILLQTLFRYQGMIDEFSANQKLVEEIAHIFHLTQKQREAKLETIYRKENRIKYSNLWHRLLFRSADYLARLELVSRPSQSVLLIQKKVWMLTEKGYDTVLRQLHLPENQKEHLPVKSYELQKQILELKNKQFPDTYNPVGNPRETRIARHNVKLRNRSFRFVVTEAYECRCAVCSLHLCSPNGMQWEVEAAHIVPHGNRGKDDIWNGLALCHLHHWMFDMGWFAISDQYKILLSSVKHSMTPQLGKCYDYDMLSPLMTGERNLILPQNSNWRPHIVALKWHRENIFHP